MAICTLSEAKSYYCYQLTTPEVSVQCGEKSKLSDFDHFTCSQSKHLESSR